MKREVFLSLGIVAIGLLGYIMGRQHSLSNFNKTLSFIEKSYPAKINITQSHQKIVETAVLIEMLSEISSIDELDETINGLREVGSYEIGQYRKHLENPYLERGLRDVHYNSAQEISEYEVLFRY